MEKSNPTNPNPQSSLFDDDEEEKDDPSNNNPQSSLFGEDEE